MSSTDAELLAAHVAGDARAFDTLYRRHRDRLWAVALRTCGNAPDAEDALQEALISALRNAANYRGEAAVTTWLHRIVINACMDVFRRRKARPTETLPDDANDASEYVGNDDLIARSDLRVALLTALDQLPIDQRAAIVLVDIEGWSVNDAAQILGVPEGTVKSRCARGRAVLATRLSSLRNPTPPGNVRPQAERPPEGEPDAASAVQPRPPSASTEEVARNDV